MIDFCGTTLRMATPLLFAATGGLLGEVCGIPLICLEGGLLVAAWVAACSAWAWGSLTLAVGLALLVGALLFWIHGTLVERSKADPIILGTALNFFALGITPLLSKNFFGTPTNTPSLEQLRIQPWRLLAEDRLLAPLLNLSWMTWLALLLPAMTGFFLYRTRLGLRIRASGANPHACSAAGVSPIAIRQLTLALAGALTALGGVFFSIAHSAQFTREMTAGRGFIALAAVLMGRGRILPTLLSCLLFGSAEAFQIHWSGGALPSQFIQAIPYLATLLLLWVWQRR